MNETDICNNCGKSDWQYILDLNLYQSDLKEAITGKYVCINCGKVKHENKRNIPKR